MSPVSKPKMYFERLIPAGKGIRYYKKYMKLTPQGVCWHWTANTGYGAGADNHWLYWNNSKYGAHYIIDDEKIIHCVPHDEVVWHAGPSSAYTDYIKKKYPKGANVSLIGVELCVNRDSKWSVTYQNAVALGAYLCKLYNWSPHKNFERHYDCTRKDCPRMMTPYVPNGDAAWEVFKHDVDVKLKEDFLVGVFRDVPSNHWAKEAIESLYKKGLIKGKAEGIFDPDGKVTRAELAVVMDRVINYVLKEVKNG